MAVEAIERNHRLAKPQTVPLPVGVQEVIEETPFREDVARVTSPDTVAVERLVKSETAQGVERDSATPVVVYKKGEIDGLKVNVGVFGRIIGRSKRFHHKSDQPK